MRESRVLLFAGVVLHVSHISVLVSIIEDLENISAQNRWVMAAYKQLNMTVINKCMRRLTDAMQEFMVCILTNDILRWPRRWVTNITISPASYWPPCRHRR